MYETLKTKKYAIINFDEFKVNFQDKLILIYNLS